jgi:Ser/Thr protein kinase RdoA (MazF antagonist)
VAIDGVPYARTCMVFGWTPGSMLRSRPNASGLAAAGRLCATLHEIAADGGKAPPHGVAIADRVVYFTVPDLLHTSTGTYGSLFVDARARVDEALDRLWDERNHTAHLIHGDLTPANVVMYHGRAGAIDFQDMVWGLDIQDISMVLAALSREPDHLGLAAAFRFGYEQRRPWPETAAHEMAALIAARRLSIANLNIAIGWPNAVASVDRQAALLRTYLSEDGDSRARH